MTNVGITPRMKLRTARAPMGASIEADASCACVACSDRGIPRKAIANALTKQVTANAAVKARATPHRANRSLIPVDESSALRSSACSVSHSLAKPLKGYIAAIDKEPIRKNAAVQGIR